MMRLARSRPILRLQDLLTGVSGGARDAGRAVMAEDIQRLMMGPQWSPRERLELLSHLARTAGTGPLPLRERELVLAELGRLALRILWGEGLFGEALAPTAPPAEAASRLLELAASDLPPDGPAFRAVMHRAKKLLRRHDVVAELTENRALRDRILDQLARAEDRVREIAA